MATFVLVHGATAGGWRWHEFAGLLRNLGHVVYAPSLTGLGDRAHLIAPTVSLDTHVQDIAGLIETEDLHSVVLVGHSYGGIVISAAAEHAHGRLEQLVYVDALVLQDGERAVDLYDAELVEQVALVVEKFGEGWKIPPLTGADPRCTSHPVSTFRQVVHLRSPKAAALAKCFIACTRRDAGDPVMQGVARSVDRVHTLGWPLFELDADHNPMTTAPMQLLHALLTATQR